MHSRPIGTVAYMGGVMAVPEAFTWSWGQMVAWNGEVLASPGTFIHYDRASVSYHAMARNSLADRMRGDWLLMLDCDHAFEPDLCARMVHRLELHGIDVLTGIYQFKNPPHSPVLYVDEGDGPRALGKWESDGLFQVHSAGAGCLMVRKGVFERIRAELGEAPFNIRPPFSEDHSFFQRLKDLNIPAYCDPRIEAHHLRVDALDLSRYDRSAVRLNDRIEVGGFA